MSSYRDHHEARIVPVETDSGATAYRTDSICTHSWADFTAARLAWLYGDEDRSAAQAADVAVWNRLGAGKAVAA